MSYVIISYSNLNELVWLLFVIHKLFSTNVLADSTWTNVPNKCSFPPSLSFLRLPMLHCFPRQKVPWGPTTFGCQLSLQRSSTQRRTARGSSEGYPKRNPKGKTKWLFFNCVYVYCFSYLLFVKSMIKLWSSRFSKVVVSTLLVNRLWSSHFTLRIGWFPNKPQQAFLQLNHLAINPSKVGSWLICQTRSLHIMPDRTTDTPIRPPFVGYSAPQFWFPISPHISSGSKRLLVSSPRMQKKHESFGMHMGQGRRTPQVVCNEGWKERVCGVAPPKRTTTN